MNINRIKFLRWLVGLLSAFGLAGIYIFQDAHLFQKIIPDGNALFVVSKSARFIANDFLMIGLIFSLFYEKKYIWFAVVLQLIGTVFFLIPYFILKIGFQSGNGPMVSFLHRLILNPTLLLLLIPAFWFQRQRNKIVHESKK